MIVEERCTVLCIIIEYDVDNRTVAPKHNNTINTIVNMKIW